VATKRLQAFINENCLETRRGGVGGVLEPERIRINRAISALAAARRREIDVVLVWRLDRWGRSLVDLVVTLKELAALGVGFVSLTEALDLTTPTGRAMAGLLSIFAEFEHEILRERIRAGIAEARLGKHFGRPLTTAKKAGQIRKLYGAGVSKAEIARRLGIGRTSVRRLLSEVQP
jgi:putative DNA-invertase from lambdoid prophage Rac